MAERLENAECSQLTDLFELERKKCQERLKYVASYQIPC
jgi:hypothetical protein